MRKLILATTSVLALGIGGAAVDHAANAGNTVPNAGWNMPGLPELRNICRLPRTSQKMTSGRRSWSFEIWGSTKGRSTVWWVRRVSGELEQFQKNNGLDRTARLDGQTMVSLLGNIGINQGSSRCSLDISDRGLAVRYDRLSCQKRGGNTWRCRSGPRSILEKRCGTFDAYSDCHIGSRSGGLGCAQRIPAGARRRCTKNDTSRRPQCAVVNELYTARTANSRVQRKGGVPVWSSTCNRVPNAITAGRWIEIMARDQGTAMARPSTGHTEGMFFPRASMWILV